MTTEQNECDKTNHKKLPVPDSSTLKTPSCTPLSSPASPTSKKIVASLQSTEPRGDMDGAAKDQTQLLRESGKFVEEVEMYSKATARSSTRSHGRIREDTIKSSSTKVAPTRGRGRKVSRAQLPNSTGSSRRQLFRRDNGQLSEGPEVTGRARLGRRSNGRGGIGSARLAELEEKRVRWGGSVPADGSTVPIVLSHGSSSTYNGKSLCTRADRMACVKSVFFQGSDALEESRRRLQHAFSHDTRLGTCSNTMERLRHLALAAGVLLAVMMTLAVAFSVLSSAVPMLPTVLAWSYALTYLWWDAGVGALCVVLLAAALGSSGGGGPFGVAGRLAEISQRLVGSSVLGACLPSVLAWGATAAVFVWLGEGRGGRCGGGSERGGEWRKQSLEWTQTEEVPGENNEGKGQRAKTGPYLLLGKRQPDILRRSVCAVVTVPFFCSLEVLVVCGYKPWLLEDCSKAILKPVVASPVVLGFRGLVVGGLEERERERAHGQGEGGGVEGVAVFETE